MLNNKSEYKFSEERRLFYVALTRTKDFCFLLVDKRKSSKFLDEIIDGCEVLNQSIFQEDEDKKCQMPYLQKWSNAKNNVQWITFLQVFKLSLLYI